MATLLGQVPSVALAIYAHPDDPEVSCGGTLAGWAAAGAEVHVVVCTAGDKGTSDPAVTPTALASRRAEEVAAAATVLGVASHHLLGHPDGAIENSMELRGELVSIIRRLRPQLVVCPDPTAVFFGQRYFNHRDHRVVGFATLDAVAHEATLPHYFPDAGAPHRTDAVYLSGTLEPDGWVDITTTVDVKAEALFCHRSQLDQPGEWLRDVVRERAEEAGHHAGVRYAEGFRVLQLS